MSAISAIFASAMVCAFPVDNVRASAGSLRSSQGDQELYPRGCGSSRSSGPTNTANSADKTNKCQKTDHSQDAGEIPLSSFHGGGPSSAHKGKGLLYSGKQRVEYIFRFPNINLPADQKPHSDEFIQYIVQKSMTKAYKDLGEDNHWEVEGIEVEMFTTQHYTLSLRDIMLDDHGFEVVIPHAPGYEPLTVQIEFAGEHAPRTVHVCIYKGEGEMDLLYRDFFLDNEVVRARDKGRYDGL
ncbi:hypothetical protein C8R42DRAFT_647281 [Lentinula raphanica]|nr:hypothetical protein C8R42DRAFT_647281 [Lentinula raphanica]